jgi:hypothetical protein
VEQVRGAGASALESVGEVVGERLGERFGDHLGILRPPPAKRSGEDALAFAGGLLMGAVVAATAAVLLAPTDGRTLRKRLQARVDEWLGRDEPDDDWDDAASQEMESDSRIDGPAQTPPVTATAVASEKS